MSLICDLLWSYIFILPSKLNKSENKQTQNTFASYNHGIDEKMILCQWNIENVILELIIFC